jgi:hypothetical protein
LELGVLEITTRSPDEFIEQAKAIVVYESDVYILAEAMAAEPDWFVTHDQAHFLNANLGSSLSIRIGTPGDLFQALEDEFTLS